MLGAMSAVETPVHDVFRQHVEFANKPTRMNNARQTQKVYVCHGSIGGTTGMATRMCVASKVAPSTPEPKP